MLALAPGAVLEDWDAELRSIGEFENFTAAYLAASRIALGPDEEEREDSVKYVVREGRLEESGQPIVLIDRMAEGMVDGARVDAQVLLALGVRDGAVVLLEDWGDAELWTAEEGEHDDFDPAFRHALARLTAALGRRGTGPFVAIRLPEKPLEPGR